MKRDLTSKLLLLTTTLSLLLIVIFGVAGYFLEYLENTSTEQNEIGFVEQYENNSVEQHEKKTVEQYRVSNGYHRMTININETSNFSMSSDVELEEVSYESLSEKSDIILTGTVKEILPSKWNSADGKRPHDSVDEFDWHDMIYTDFVISVDEYLKNPLQDEEVVVRVFTGTVGEDVSVSDYAASFQSGEKVFLYLAEDDWEYTKDLGPEHYFVFGSAQGKLTLMDDGTAVGEHGNINLSELTELISG